MKENFGRTAPEYDNRRSTADSIMPQPKAPLAPPVHSMWTSAAAASAAATSPLHSDDGHHSSAEEELQSQGMPMHLQADDKRDSGMLHDDCPNQVLHSSSSLMRLHSLVAPSLSRTNT